MNVQNSKFRTHGSHHSSLVLGSSGQALVETALLVPFLLMIAFNVVNFGYFFVIALNLAAAPRSGALYSIVGQSSPASARSSFQGLPPAGPPGTITSVSYLSLNDLNGAVYNGGSAGVQVCSASVGVSNAGTASQTSQCGQWNSSPSYTVDADPEAPSFVLNRVDVTYTFSPLIPGTPFNLILLASPVCSSGSGVTCTFHRMAEMRAMN